jgi:hypothetical protein
MCNNHIIESSVCFNGKKFSLVKSRPVDGDGWIFTIDAPDVAQESMFMPKDVLDPDKMKALYLLTKQPCGEIKK